MVHRLRLLLALAALACASDARALIRIDVLETTTSHGHPLDALVLGETLTLGLRFAEIDRSGGVGISAWAYDERVIDFLHGQAVPSINHSVCIGTFFNPPCLGGLTNWRAGALQEDTYGGGGSRVQIFLGVSLVQTSTNPLDPGLDGVVGGGDAQFRITFVATGLGTTTIRIGTHYPGDGVLDSGNHNRESYEVEPLRIHVVPEPGTATLIGLGLASVALSRRARPTTSLLMSIGLVALAIRRGSTTGGSPGRSAAPRPLCSPPACPWPWSGSVRRPS